MDVANRRAACRSGHITNRKNMNLLVIRHGIAAEREEFAKSGKDDGLRPLTREGRRNMSRAAKGLRRIVPKIDVLAASPLTRAVQTADIVAEAFPKPDVVRLAALSPGAAPAALLDWLRARPDGATVALVGHEPHLGTFVCWMLTGLQESFFPMKKGGACMLEVSDPLRAGRARLLWAMKPSQLRKLKG